MIIYVLQYNFIAVIWYQTVEIRLAKEAKEKMAEMLLVFLHWVEANLSANLKRIWEGQMR